MKISNYIDYWSKEIYRKYRKHYRSNEVLQQHCFTFTRHQYRTCIEWQSIKHDTAAGGGAALATLLLLLTQVFDRALSLQLQKCCRQTSALGTIHPNSPAHQPIACSRTVLYPPWILDWKSFWKSVSFAVRFSMILCWPILLNTSH